VIGRDGEKNGNQIGFNGVGVLIEGADTTGNKIINNLIGTDLAGDAEWGNGSDGIRITKGANNNFIGGTEAGAGNTIAFNEGAGVLVTKQAIRNSIRGNSIYENSQVTGFPPHGVVALGIDLSDDDITADGPTNNDFTDPDNGGNLRQNHPVIAFAVSLEGGTTAAMSLNSTPNTTFQIEFFGNDTLNPGGLGEGKYFLGTTTATTDATGDAAIVRLVPSIAKYKYLTATATDPVGNTSEFSRYIEVLDKRICTFLGFGLLDDGDWLAGDNWTCDLREGLPDLTTTTRIGTMEEPQIATIHHGDDATANQVEIPPGSTLTVSGTLESNELTNGGLLHVNGLTKVQLGLNTQPTATIQLGTSGSSGIISVTGTSSIGGTLLGQGTLDLSHGRTLELQATINPGFVANGSLQASALSVAAQVGTITVVGDTDLVSSTVFIDILGTATHDSVVLAGAGRLGGILSLTVAETAPVGTYTIITCTAGCSGQFDEVQVALNRSVELAYTNNAVTITLREMNPSIFLPLVIR